MYIKVIDDDICIKKMNRNCKKPDKKIWRVLKCKKIVVLHDFPYKV